MSSQLLPQKKMPTVSEYLEDVIEKCGGYGKYQVVLTVILFATKISITWTMMMMAFAGAKPNWWCESEDGSGNLTTTFQECSPFNSSECIRYKYDSAMLTVINQWDLLCDSAWVTSTITTIQMAGVLVGGLLCGQMGDYFGRKPTLFFGILLITVTNIIAVFSVSWQMFAVLRFFMGISCGVNLTVYIVLLFEFISVRNRAVVGGIPSWTLFAAIFALMSWALHDWRYLHIATAISGAPLLFTWWIVPESFRWLVAHSRFDEARVVIQKMARFNGVPEPDVSDLEKLRDPDSATTYTVLDIFKGKHLLTNTIYLGTMWLTCGYVYYAISFSVQSLSGSMYLNMFLLSALEIPANATTIFLNNRVGRKWSAMSLFIISAIGSLGVAIVQVLEAKSTHGDALNAFALMAKLGCAAGWVCLAVLSTEIYPTVVRNIGYGFHNTAARVGGMIAPQLIFLSDSHPGLLYFLCAGMMVVSAICAALSTETRNAKLEDILYSKEKKKPLLEGKEDESTGKGDEKFIA